MIRRQRGQVHLTGQDETTFSIILFLMSLILDGNNATRRDVHRAIHYFRDLGLPLNEGLFAHIVARWDTRLAWGTTARMISFPMDERDPARGISLVYRARRKEIWKRMCEAVGYRTLVSAPRWLSNTTEFSDDLPIVDAVLPVMAAVCGTDLLNRLTEWTQPERDPTPPDHASATSSVDPRIEAIFETLRADPEIEIGFRQRRWLKLDRW